MKSYVVGADKQHIYINKLQSLDLEDTLVRKYDGVCSLIV